MKIHVKIQAKTFSVKIGDIKARPIQAEVDGEIFEVWPQETLLPSGPSPAISQTPQIIHPIPQVESNGTLKNHSESADKLIAPIPGVIVEITANAGDSVTYGQELCVLEAMKMKNSIRANRDGQIKKILISTGDHVRQSQVLMEFEKKAE